MLEAIGAVAAMKGIESPLAIGPDPNSKRRLFYPPTKNNRLKRT